MVLVQDPQLAAPTAVLGTGGRLSKGQKRAAAAITADAPCTPVLVRAAITGHARMPRARLEITSPVGDVIGNVSLPNTSAAFDPQVRWWLVGDPVPGERVALISEGATQVLLPGGPLRQGPVRAQDFSPVACRFLGWRPPVAGASASTPPEWAAVFREGGAIDGPAFTRAVTRFRVAAVLMPLIFFLVCFPYLFVIPSLARSGVSMPALLALPVLGGGITLWWSHRCRMELVAEAERIEAGASQHGKAIAFTQSYWAGMRKPAKPWEGAIPAIVRQHQSGA